MDKTTDSIISINLRFVRFVGYFGQHTTHFLHFVFVDNGDEGQGKDKSVEKRDFIGLVVVDQNRGGDYSSRETTRENFR